MLKQRLLTVVVVLPLLLACIFLLPNPGWALLMTVPTTLAALEWSKLSGYGRRARAMFVAAVLASCLLLIAVAAGPRSPAMVMNLATVLFVLALLFWAIAVPVWLYSKWQVSHPLLLAVAGWIVLVPAWLAVVRLQQSAWLLLVVLGVVWIADTAAYFAGHRFGRNKLAPQISPGKTWEGVIGAYIAVLGYALAASLILQPSANGYDHLAVLLFACVLTAFGIVGDLFESWIKRQAGAKDSGQLLPGHGGVLDRIDSLTAALPFAALYFIQVVWSA
ncbi:MAG TPA: phosphatidate cytidylyltransferase [Burkholderiales bacterium]|jgi:phosphatidate cytidylyltransferase|nr:phosphatidate cytidylyltransferase [Burkholderiales bacterium]